MSKAYPDVPNSLTSAQQYVRWLIKALPVIKAVYLTGSRSPTSHNKPRIDSDWDIQVVSDLPQVIIPNPRTTKILNADITFYNPKHVVNFPKSSVEIWPTDKAGFFKDEQAARPMSSGPVKSDFNGVARYT
jgi:hypothetical protein